MTTSLLRQSGFRLLLTAKASSVIGTAMAPVGIAFAVLDATGRPTDLGLVLGARALPMVALLLLGGVVGDRRNRRHLLIICDATLGLSQAATAALVLTGRVSLVPLMLLQAIGGCALAFAHPAFTGFVPQVVGPADRRQANASLSLVRNGGLLFGAPLGGLLAAAASPGWALAVDAATYFISAGCWALLRGHEQRASTPAATMGADLVGGWNEVRRHTWLWVVIVQFAVTVGVGEAAFDVLAPVVAKERLGGAWAFGALLTAEALGAIAGGVIALRIRPTRPMFLAVGLMLLYTPELFLLAGVAPLWALLPAAVLAGLAIQLFIVLWDTALQDHIPPAALSRVAAYDAFGSNILFPVGLALMGPLAGWIGVRGALTVGALGVLIPTLAALFVRQIRVLPRVDHSTEAVIPAGVK